MSSDLEEIYKCIFEARVPSTWQKVNRKNYEFKECINII
jgi:hypothetical protein